MIFFQKRMIFQRIIELFRINEWLVTKLLFNYFAVFLFIFFVPQIDKLLLNKLMNIGMIALYIFSIGSFGYMINDWFDSKSDLIAGKKNAISAISFKSRVVILFLLISIGIVPFIFMFDNLLVYLILVIVQVFLLVVYSAGSCKLKKNILGLVADSFYSFVLPTAISVLLVIQKVEFHQLLNANLIMFFVWLLLIGLRSILLHQSIDYKNDVISKSETFTTKRGLIINDKLSKAITIIEILLFFILLGLSFEKLWFAFVVSIVLYVLLEWAFNKQKMSVKNNFKYFISQLNVYYNVYLICGITFLLSWQDDVYYVIIPIIIIFIRLKNQIIELFKKMYYSIILYLFYKLIGFCKRVLRIFK